MLTYQGRQNGDKYSMHVHMHVPHAHVYVCITLIRKL